MRHKIRKRGQARRQRRRDAGGVQRPQTDAFHARDGRHPRGQLAQRHAVVRAGLDAGEHQLLHPGADRAGGLVENFRRVARAGRSAQRRDDAVGTAARAAVLYFQKRAAFSRFAAGAREDRHRLVAPAAGRHRRGRRLAPTERQRGCDRVGLARAAAHIAHAGAGGGLLGPKLRKAADGDHMRGLSARAAEKLRALALALGGDGAGIDHADVAGRAKRHDRKAGRPKPLLHRLRFIRVDAAAERIKGYAPREGRPLPRNGRGGGRRVGAGMQFYVTAFQAFPLPFLRPVHSRPRRRRD